VHRRCRRCNRPIKNARWRAVGLGRKCALILGLRLVTPRPTLAPIGPARPVEPDDDQLALFDPDEKEG
jgi:hypothetical protein